MCVAGDTTGRKWQTGAGQFGWCSALIQQSGQGWPAHMHTYMMNATSLVWAEQQATALQDQLIRTLPKDCT